MSINKIKESYPQIIPDTSTFNLVLLEYVKEKNNESRCYEIIFKQISKKLAHVCLPFLTNSTNHSPCDKNFPNELKQFEGRFF